MKLDKHDYIVCAYAQPASGPGWANRPIWVIVQDGDKNLRRECLQPEDQTPEMAAWYRVSSEVHHALTDAVRKLGE